MTDAEHIGQLEARLDALERLVETEMAEREALQQVVVPPLAEVRKELDMNVAYFTQRLEASRARPADEPDDGDIDEIYGGLLSLLKFQNATDEQLRWLTGIVTRSLERQARLLRVAVEPTR
jgi:hypothetical protein